MEKKSNWQEFKAILDLNKIVKLYHFTDRDNLESIIKNGGLYSWGDCEDKGIKIAKPGGGLLSRELDARDRLQHYVRVSFTTQHPMMYEAMKDGRLSNPVILEIDPEVIFWKDSKYANMNATKTGCNKGSTIDDFKMIHFQSVKAHKHFDLPENEQPYFQAEILVKNSIPLEYIKNIGNFGIPIPSKPKALQIKNPYTAQITRNTPTAFIFLVDQSISMSRKLYFKNEYISLAEAVARIVNAQIYDLVLRCVKMDDVRHYYDIAVIGYGDDASYGWKGALAGRDFVSPEELRNNPFRKVIVKEEKRTKKGMVLKEVMKYQWVEPIAAGKYTRAHKAFGMAKDLLDKWMKEHHEKDCYPPTIINITDGAFNGIANPREVNTQLANELKALFTNDGNVLLWNIHITPDNQEQILLPISKIELNEDKYSEWLYDMSSLLTSRYNIPIGDLRGDAENTRHVAMATNTDLSTLIQLMDIGTPTNISPK
jgi:hypothetical protein